MNTETTIAVISGYLIVAMVRTVLYWKHLERVAFIAVRASIWQMSREEIREEMREHGMKPDAEVSPLVKVLHLPFFIFDFFIVSYLVGREMKP